MAKHVAVIVKDGNCIVCAECDGSKMHEGPHNCGHACTHCGDEGLIKCLSITTSDGTPLLMRCEYCAPFVSVR